MHKTIVAATVVMAGALGAFAANISGVSTINAESAGDTYLASPIYSAAEHNLSEAGWYSGLTLTWNKNKQKVSDTTVTVLDNINVIDLSFKANSVPAGSGIANTTTTNWLQSYLATTTWYFSVTPEMMYECFKAEKDYEITLTIGGNAYTITVPNDIILNDGSRQWYPAVGLMDGKVYGEAQYLADQITLANYQDVKFLVDPSELTFPDGFAAGDEVDGVWGVKMLHNHEWSFNVVDGTNLVASCGNANCPYNNGEVRMWLDVGTTGKVYDGLSVTRKPVFGEFFEDAFNGVKTSLTVNGSATGAINNAGEYDVVLKVTDLGDGATYELSTVVTIDRKDIAGEALAFSPASTTYNAAEQTVTPSVTVDGLAATIEVAEGSTTAATEIGEYSVTVNGTGNFTGTTSGTWAIVNTTGSMGGVASAASEESGICEDGILTITDTSALEYDGSVWTAGLVLTWPLDKKDYSGLGQYGHAYYVTEDSVRVSAAAGTVEHASASASYRYNLISSPEFTYLSNTVWTVELTPAAVEAALADGKTALEYTMRAGAIQSETYEQGVAFADYKIELSLEEPVVFALGEGEVYDLGETVLTTTRIRLEPGASVTSTVEQTTEGAIFTGATGYEIECTESDGVYTYATKFTHRHAWSIEVVDGTNLVSRCMNDECDLGGEVRMWLYVETPEKDYDGVSVKRYAQYGEGFAGIYPEVSATVTVNGVENGVVNDAGEYAVALAVTGLGNSEPYVLSTTVKINRRDIADGTLSFTPSGTLTYNAAEQMVEPAVAIGDLAATVEAADGSTLAATEIGRYSVTVNGTGNFTGSLSGTWDIINTTGSMKSVTAANAGAGTVENNTLTVTDTKALGYSDGVWTAGLVLEWPMTKRTVLGVATGADYVTEDAVGISAEQGEIAHELKDDSYIANWSSTPYTYLATTTWTVGLTPEMIEAALAEEKTALEYTMRAGAFQCETYEQGVAFAYYKIVIPLEDIKLYDGEGRQVYPKTAGQTIIEEIKDEIGAAVLDGGTAQNAAAKIDLLAETAGDGNEQSVADWVADMKTGYASAEAFYTELAGCEYVKASFELGTDELITGESEVEVVGFETTDSGFAFAVAVDGDDVEAARVKAAGIIRTAASLDEEFARLDADRIGFDGGKITIGKAVGATREFFKIVINKDGAPAE